MVGLADISLKDKVAIITGAGGGLGREIVLAMARSGAKVVLVARRPGPLEEVARDVQAMGRDVLVINEAVDDRRVDDAADLYLDSRTEELRQPTAQTRLGKLFQPFIPVLFRQPLGWDKRSRNFLRQGRGRHPVPRRAETL